MVASSRQFPVGVETSSVCTVSKRLMRPCLAVQTEFDRKPLTACVPARRSWRLACLFEVLGFGALKGMGLPLDLGREMLEPPASS